jgi:hypothetical protein
LLHERRDLAHLCPVGFVGLQRLVLGDHGIWDIVVDPAGSTAYGWTTSAVYRLPGSSATWDDITGNLGFGTSAIVVHPQGVLAITFDGAFYLSNVAPPAWSSFNGGLPADDFLLGGAVDGAGRAFTVDLSGHVWAIGAADPTWTAADSGIPSGAATSVWTDVSRGGHVLLGTAASVNTPNVGQGPLWRTLDAGGTWTRAATGIQAVLAEAIAVDPHHAGTVLAATSSDGVERSTDGGRTWRRSKGLRGQPVGVAVDPAHPNIVLATINGFTLERSIDGGATWKVVAGERPGRVAFGSGGVAWEVGSKVRRSADGGKTWTPYAGTTGLSGVIVHTMQPDLSAGGALFQGTSDGVYRLPNRGDTWGRVGLRGVDVFSLAVDGGRSSTVYAGTDDGVWRSTNDGVSWRRVLNRPSTSQVATAPGHAGVVYARATTGVLRSTDGGGTWKSVGNLGEVPLHLAGAADGRTVFAATNGMGVEAFTTPA